MVRFGDLSKLTFALYKLAEVEERINDHPVIRAIGPDGRECIEDLHIAMNLVSGIVTQYTDYTKNVLRNQIGETLG